jgi:uncharacterized protein YdhG (YjbR/CyaY superfamily)
MATTKKQDRTATSNTGFTADEKAAMKERAAELKRQQTKASGEADLEAKIADLTGSDKASAEAIDRIVKQVAPDLEGRTYYGMPAWAKDGKVLVFFQPASKFGTRYATIGFNDGAKLDDGAMWPTAYGLTDLGAKDEARLTEIIKQAAG